MPYGRSPFALSIGTPEARITVTVGVIFSSSTGIVGCSTGVGDASAGFKLRELGRRGVRLVFLSAGLGVGRGWKAFETDWPTFLKKSPTGSAFTHRPLNKNSARIDDAIQRDRMKNLMMMGFNVKAEFSARIGTYEKQKIALHGILTCFKMNNASGATAAGRQVTRQIFRNNHPQEY